LPLGVDRGPGPAARVGGFRCAIAVSVCSSRTSLRDRGQRFFFADFVAGFAGFFALAFGFALAANRAVFAACFVVFALFAAGRLAADRLAAAAALAVFAAGFTVFALAADFTPGLIDGAPR
jgi:hypothetical protein